MKNRIFLGLPLLAFVIILGQIVSCKKESTTTTTPPVVVCDVRGTYSGSYTDQIAISGTFVYILKDNNFTTGSATLTSAQNAFGGYSNTCDSIRLNSYNTINGNYYYFEGKFSNSTRTITGIYKNLSMTSEYGTFTLTKQ